MSIVKYERTCPVAPIQLEFIDDELYYYMYSDASICRSVEPLKEIPEDFRSVYCNIECDEYGRDDTSPEFEAFSVKWDDPDFDSKVLPALEELLKEAKEAYKK